MSMLNSTCPDLCAKITMNLAHTDLTLQSYNKTKELHLLCRIIHTR